jgi:hypothetical protein
MLSTYDSEGLRRALLVGFGVGLSAAVMLIEHI